ncbi:MAG: hypothetical protein DDT31_01169 [Syntrophomonadaceae bacterium]|nr:hypothetical protein [Bacillota bacterium]MBT9147252.1 hypothetical protein [Bacillota bacterium]
MQKTLLTSTSREVGTAQRITQHKRFVPFCTHPNSAFGGTSFMLETLGAMPCLKNLEGVNYARNVEI